MPEECWLTSWSGRCGKYSLKGQKTFVSGRTYSLVITIEGDTGNVIAGPDVISRGFVYVRESEDLMEEIRECAKLRFKNAMTRKRMTGLRRKAL